MGKVIGFKSEDKEREMISFLCKNTDAKTASQVLRKGLYTLYEETLAKVVNEVPQKVSRNIKKNKMKHSISHATRN